MSVSAKSKKQGSINSNNLIRNSVQLAIFASLAASAATQAQQAPASSSDESVQEVVVTGSMIKRSDFETPSPVQVLTSDDITKAGYTSVAQALSNLSANGQGALSQSFGLAFAGGGSGIALRGLTVGGTLTLVDSERMVPYPLSDDGQRNFVDITEIPLNVVDRIDVLKDGASAAYGSDAIAGVVNVILKKTYVGFAMDGDAGMTQQRDGATERLSAIYGVGDLASDGYNAYLGIEWRHQDPILNSSRSGAWNNLDWTQYGGADTRFGANDQDNAPYPALLGGYVLNPATNALDSTTHFLGTGGNSCTSYAAYQANQCIYPAGFQIQPQTGNLNVLGRFTKSLWGDWQFQTTASLFRSEAEQVGQNGVSYPVLNGLNPFTGIAYAAGVNPTAITTPAVLLPVGAPNNPFSAPAALVLDYPQLGMVNTQFVTSTYRLFSDLKGTAAGFDIDATAGFMYSALIQKGYGDVNPGAVAAAAAEDYNFATATPADLIYNFFPEVQQKDTNTMQVVDLHASRSVWTLPGGDLSVGAAVGYYHLYKNSPAPDALANATQVGNAAYAVGGQTDDNASVEINAPIVKGLEVDVSGRYDHYLQYGGSATPKFGVKYSPIDFISFRGTFGKGFRAPNPAESGKAGSLFSGFAGNNYVLCPNPANQTAAGNFPSQCNAVPVGLQVTNPNLQPEKSKNWTAGIILTPVHNTTVSFDYWDIKINQDIQAGTSLLFLGADPSLFPVVYGPPVSLPYCTADGVCNTVTSTAIKGAGVGPALYQAFPYFNLSTTHTNGVDVDLMSKFDIGAAGRLTVQLNSSYMIHYYFGLPGDIIDLAGSHGPSIISGDTGNPKLKGTFSLSWDIGKFDLTASVNYSGRMNLLDPTAGYGSCEVGIAYGGLGGRFPDGPSSVNALAVGQLCEVHAFTDLDLYSSYAVTDHLSLHASIQNVINSQPPIDANTYGAAGNDAYNPSFAQAGAVGRFFNVGASYKFW